jgi:hypothetical protein
VGDQPVRLNNAVVVARMCAACGTIEMRGREAPAAVPTQRHAPGREVLHGFVRNVAVAVTIRAVCREARDRYRARKTRTPSEK